MEKLLDIVCSLKQMRQNYLEEQTKLSFVIPILQSLGWNIYNPDEVEAQSELSNGKVDYALKKDGKYLLFIECKKSNEQLQKHEDQLLKYTYDQGVKLAILTNGLHWWFYLPLKEGSWHERNFLKIDFKTTTPDRICKRLNEFLSKTNVIDETAYNNAEQLLSKKHEKDKIEKNIPIVWNKLVSEGNKDLIKLIRDKVFEYSGFRPKNYKPTNDRIKEFLEKTKIDQVTRPADTMQGKKIKSHLLNPPIPNIEIIEAILEILKNNNNRLNDEKIQENFYNHFREKFTQPNSDWKNRNERGLENWKKVLQNTRKSMVMNGYIEKAGKQNEGIWQLTEKGIQSF